MNPSQTVPDEEQKYERLLEPVHDDEDIRIIGSRSDLGEMSDEESLGSELSGISVEIPNEIVHMHLSANYLTSYNRDYKSNVMV